MVIIAVQLLNEEYFQLFYHAGWPDERSYLFLGDYVDRGWQVKLICIEFIRRASLSCNNVKEMMLTLFL